MAVPISTLADAVVDTASPVPTSVLISAIIALASVVAYLFKRYADSLENERKAGAKLIEDRATERTAWAVERAELEAELETTAERMRADYEQKFRDLLVRHDEIAAREREAGHIREAAQRKEFAEAIETMALKAEESSAALVATLDKFYDRFVGPRGGRH